MATQTVSLSMHRPQEENKKAFHDAPDSLHVFARRHALVISSAALDNRGLAISCTSGTSDFFCEEDSNDINRGGCVCHFNQTERATCRSHELATEDQNADGARCTALKTHKMPHLIGREACLQCKSHDAKGMLYCTNVVGIPLRTSSKSCRCGDWTQREWRRRYINLAMEREYRRLWLLSTPHC